MANNINPSVGSYNDVKFLAFFEAVNIWLKDDAHFAKTRMPAEKRTELDTLVTQFADDLIKCKNIGMRTQMDVAKKNETRAKLQNWFSTVFQPFIWKNKGNISDVDLVDMGYHARPKAREHVPPPTKVICLLKVRTRHDGNVFVTAMGEGKTLGKPQDVDGIELERYDEDPRLNPDAIAIPLGRFTNVKQEIRFKFPPEDYGKTIYIRGRWYNNNGVSGWSPLVSALIQGGQ